MRVGERRVRGTRSVRAAPWWISLCLQAGNRDDALLHALHGRDWLGKATRRRRHLATTASRAAAVAGLVLRRPVVAAVDAAGWLVGTAELAWARIAPGPAPSRRSGRCWPRAWPSRPWRRGTGWPAGPAVAGC